VGASVLDSKPGTRDPGRRHYNAASRIESAAWQRSRPVSLLHSADRRRPAAGCLIRVRVTQDLGILGGDRRDP